MKPLGGRERTRKDIAAGTQTTHKEVRDFYSGMRQATKEIDASKKRQQEQEYESRVILGETQKLSNDIINDSYEFAQEGIEKTRKDIIKAEDYKRSAENLLEQTKKDASKMRADAEKKAKEAKEQAEAIKMKSIFDTDMYMKDAETIVNGIVRKEIKPSLKNGEKHWSKYDPQKPIEPRRLEEFKEAIIRNGAKLWDSCKELFDSIPKKIIHQRDQNVR